MKKILITLLSILSILVLCGCSSVTTYTGKLEYTGTVKDEELNVEVDAPILIREVEMVQYYKDENGNVKTVLANYPIDSFDGYTNPEFKMNNAIIHGELKINGVVLSEEMIKAIVYSDNVKKIKVDVDGNSGNKLGLVYLDGSYVTASNDYELGDIKVTYYYIDGNNSYKLTGAIIDDKLDTCDKYLVEIEG